MIRTLFHEAASIVALGLFIGAVLMLPDIIAWVRA